MKCVNEEEWEQFGCDLCCEWKFPVFKMKN